MKKEFELYSEYIESVTNIDVMSKSVINYENKGYHLYDYEFINGAEDYLKLFFVKF
jgi:hypothetical protein